MKTYVLHHSDTDGYGAKYAAWEKLRDTAEYHPVNYNQPCPILDKVHAGDTVYILDFCYPREVISALAEKGVELCVIDHHKTTVETFGEQPWLIFDVTKSGCVLAWEHFVEYVYGDTAPEILLTVQDWDLWQFKRENTKAIHLVAECNKEDMSWWQAAGKPGNIEQIAKTGIELLKYHNGVVDAFAEHAWLGTFDGHRVAVANVVYPFISDAGQKIRDRFGDSIDMSMTFFIDENGKKVWSLRSATVDVGSLAKKYGGGGHKDAAGMVLSDEVGPSRFEVSP